MVEFGIGLGIIIALGIAALIIDAGRDHTTIDNTAEYIKMFDEGMIERKKNRHT